MVTCQFAENLWRHLQPGSGFLGGEHGCCLHIHGLKALLGCPCEGALQYVLGDEETVAHARLPPLVPFPPLVPLTTFSKSSRIKWRRYLDLSVSSCLVRLSMRLMSASPRLIE